MNGQAHALQEYIQKRNLSQILNTKLMDGESQGKVITVTSGKGGVGKSTVVMNLGLATGQKTLLVDGDLLLGNLLMMIGKQPSVSWKDIFVGHAAQNFPVHSINNNTDILGGVPFGDEKKMHLYTTATALSRLVREWRQQYELILIDTATGLGMRVLEWSLIADHVVMVTTPDPASCANTYALAKSLYLTKNIQGIGVVISQYLQEENPWKVFKQLELMTHKLLDNHLYYWGSIPWLEEIAQSTRHQVPVLCRDTEHQLEEMFQEMLSTIITDTENVTNSFQFIG